MMMVDAVRGRLFPDCRREDGDAGGIFAPVTTHPNTFRIPNKLKHKQTQAHISKQTNTADTKKNKQTTVAQWSIFTPVTHDAYIENRKQTIANINKQNLGGTKEQTNKKTDKLCKAEVETMQEACA